jgi:hypothetical protein
MKTLSSEKIKEIRNQIREINKNLKMIEEQEENQEAACNNEDYKRAEREAGYQCLLVMNRLSVVVSTITNIGCIHNAYDINTYHRIVEYNMNEEISKLK